MMTSVTMMMLLLLLLFLMYFSTVSLVYLLASFCYLIPSYLLLLFFHSIYVQSFFQSILQKVWAEVIIHDSSDNVYLIEKDLYNDHN